jgi:cytidine deaminase
MSSKGTVSSHISAELLQKIPELYAKLKQKEDAAVREEMYKALLQVAEQAASNYYAPYSTFPVGAAILDTEGRLFYGCNVEIANYGGAICAERTAIVKAVSEGSKGFDYIAVLCKKAKDAWPCGYCRQFIAEFGANTTIISQTKAGELEVLGISDLLPRMFGPHSLPDFVPQN